MTRISYFLLIVFIFCQTLCLTARPRVGIVLSGGGAKGMAHIGALKVIEEAGIPVDMIVGTSMGSIIGGLYAIGYTTEQLDSIVMAQDWSLMLSDKISPKKLSLQTREQNSQYILSVPFFERPKDLIGGGVIKGRNIGQMLWQMTEGYHDSIDFKKLPIPFACVAQDLVSGDEIVFKSGILPIAIRSSMSIPGVFAPVAYNEQLLIDGGLMNNYPVDIAREMGADIIIGVDVQDPMKSAKEMQGSILAQLSQLIDLQGKEKWHKNIESSDVYIKVNVEGYNTASFTTTAIDTLIERGETAARLKIDTLRIIGKKLNKEKSKTIHSAPPYYNIYRTEMPLQSESAALKTLIGDAPTSSINVGFRFDNEELAALIFNGQLRKGIKKNHQMSLTVRLGRQVFGDVHYNFLLGKEWVFSTAYRFTYNDFNIYKKGEKAYNVDFKNHSAKTGFVRSWKNMTLKLGGSFQHYNYGSFLYSMGNNSTTNISKESFLMFGTQYTINTLNDTYFPTQGNKLGLEYHYAIPLTQHKKTFHVAELHWNGAYSFNSRFTLLPRLEGRYLTTENTIAEMNTLGGQERGKYFQQQMCFYGINNFEITRKTLVVAGIEARQRIGGKHYVSGAFNLAMTSNDWSHFFKNSFGKDESKGFRAWGGAIRYDLRTFFGPIGITLQYSDRAKFSGYVRAGFNF